MNVLLTVALVVLSADPKVEIADNKLLLPQPILFETGKATIKDESGAMLDLVKNTLAEKSYVSTLRIEVHSDAQGNEKLNQELSQARAKAIFEALVKRGIDCKRLLAVGFGSTKPIADNRTAEGRAQNRRTEFVIAALRGKAIGGMPLDGGGVVAAPPCE
ncbi:MAG: OmpA family protein [Archangium sp.]|nr:OmpA family protein [Archangium sp.]